MQERLKRQHVDLANDVVGAPDKAAQKVQHDSGLLQVLCLGLRQPDAHKRQPRNLQKGHGQGGPRLWILVSPGVGSGLLTLEQGKARLECFGLFDQQRIA